MLASCLWKVPDLVADDGVLSTLDRKLDRPPSRGNQDVLGLRRCTEFMVKAGTTEDYLGLRIRLPKGVIVSDTHITTAHCCVVYQRTHMHLDRQSKQ